jgi:multidrug efflux pump subunit AcrA (membrane-fusion protein)
MKVSQIVITVVVVAASGLAVFLLLRSHRPAAEASESEAPAPIVSVQVGALKSMTLHSYVTGYGTVEPAQATADEPAADAPVAAPVAGVIARVKVAVGAHVAKGQVLAELDSAGTTFTYAEQEVARQKELYAQHNTSLRSLQGAEMQLALLRVTAPLAGTVVRLNVKPGAAVDPTIVVAEIVDLDRLVVKTTIPVSQAGELALGQATQVRTQPAVTATLSFISPTVSTNDDTVVAWSAMPAGSGLRPGQFVPLRIVTAVLTNCLAAPEESVVTDIHGKSTIALVKGEEAIQTPVQTGPRENGWVEVNAPGLKAGDAVVTVGAYGLPQKTKIQVVNP